MECIPLVRTPPPGLNAENLVAVFRDITVWVKQNHLVVREGQDTIHTASLAWFPNVHVAGTKLYYLDLENARAVSAFDLVERELTIHAVEGFDIACIWSVRAYPKENMILACTTRPNCAYIWRGSQGSVLEERDEHALDVCGARNRACIAWDDCTLSFLDLEHTSKIRDVDLQVRAMDMTRDARFLVVACSDDGCVSVLDVETGVNLAILGQNFAMWYMPRYASLKISPDDTCVACVCTVGSLSVLDLRTGRAMVQLSGEKNRHSDDRPLEFRDEGPDGTLVSRTGEYRLTRKQRILVLPLCELGVLEKKDGDHAIKCRVLQMLL